MVNVIFSDFRYFLYLRRLGSPEVLPTNPQVARSSRAGRAISRFFQSSFVNLPSYAESHACVPCLRRSGFAQAGEAHYGAQARGFSRPWMNARRVPFEAPKERSRVCFGGFRLPARSRFGEGRPDEACGGATDFSPWGSTLLIN